jgi:hypothetical protein
MSAYVGHTPRAYSICRRSRFGAVSKSARLLDTGAAASKNVYFASRKQSRSNLQIAVLKKTLKVYANVLDALLNEGKKASQSCY